MTLEIRTLNVVLAVVLLSFAVTFGAVWLSDHGRRRVGFVATAYVGIGIASLLTAFSDGAPNSPPANAASFIGCAGFLLLWRSTRLPSRRPPLGAEIGLLATATALLALYTFVRPDVSGGTIIISAFGFVISTLCACEILRGPRRTLDGHSMLTVSAFLGLGLLTFHLGLAAAWHKITGNSQAGLANGLELMAAMALYVMLGCGALWSSFQAEYDESERANRARSTFLARVSHDLRTPLNAALGFAELLLASPLTPSQRRQLNMLKDAESSQIGLVKDLLDLATLEGGKLRLSPVPTELAGTVNSAIEMLRPAAQTKGLNLQLDLHPSLPAWILVDPGRLRQILVNLVDNAIKFTDQGNISITINRDAAMGREQLRFAVSDTGVGIQEGREDQLFKEFSRIDGQADQRRVGTGLGLAICKGLAEAMGGAIGFRNAPGAGSIFWFTIDLIEVAPPELVLSSSRRKKKQQCSRIDAGKSNALSCLVRSPSKLRGGARVRKTGPAAEQRRLRILVAEDSIPSAIVINAMLRHEGHDVAMVETGKAALEAVRHSDLDLILMDIDLPEMNGIVASREIRKFPAPACNIPILALTGSVTEVEMECCRNAGMDGYLTKPIDRITLRRALAERSAGVFRSPTIMETFRAIRSDLDFATLNILENQIGYSNLLPMLKASCREITAALSVVEAAMERGKMARCAHQLISMGGYLGCTELTRGGQDLIDAIRSEKPDLAPFISKFKAAARRTRKAIIERYPEVGTPSAGVGRLVVSQSEI